MVIDSAEPEFRFDRQGHVVGAEMSVQTESHRLIERLMIAANEQVASFLDEHRIPTLYRVHERPDGPAAERLIEQLESLGVPTPPVPGGALTPQQAAEVVAEASSLVARLGGAVRPRRPGPDQPGAAVAEAGVLRLGQPRSCRPGLAALLPLHLADPALSRPDLPPGTAVGGGREPAPDASWVASAGPWTSTRERQAMTIERDADDVARCFLLERELV